MSEDKEKYEGVITADGFDDALLGTDSESGRAIYSISKMVKVLMDRDNMNFEEALEFFDFNIAGTKFTSGGPIYCDDL